MSDIVSVECTYYISSGCVITVLRYNDRKLHAAWLGDIISTVPTITLPTQCWTTVLNNKQEI